MFEVIVLGHCYPDTKTEYHKEKKLIDQYPL